MDILLKKGFTWKNVYEVFQTDLKLFIFIIMLLFVFRLSFIVTMGDYLGESTILKDVMLSLYYGFKISLKSAGILAGTSFLICLLASIFVPKFYVKIRMGLASCYVLILTILFYVRIPYYQQFHAGFNQLIFNTFNDDVSALTSSLLQEYNLPLRFGIAFVTAFILIKVVKWWLNTKIVYLPTFSKHYANIGVRIVFLLAIYNLAIFIRFGGSMSYAYNVDWENSGVTKDQLLNEAILDDVQALYRAYELNNRLLSSVGMGLESSQVVNYAKSLTAKNFDSNNLDDYLKQEAQGAKIPKPQHIFLIIGENYANWPLLPQYQHLNIANGLKGIIAKDNATYVNTFLPNGMSTVSAVMGVLTGFADANLYLTQMPEAYKQPYQTAIAHQIGKLGYRANFWYAGPSSWENVREFSLAQGFKAFYSSGDFDKDGGNVWGCDDKDLYQAVLKGIKNEDASFNVILTVSNHSPYTVDLAAAGFNPDLVEGPAEVKNDPELMKKLGHFWYADKMLAEFIETAEQKYPDSLFIIVGDHADRVNIDKTPSVYERYGIPLVLYGKGVNKEILAQQVAGSHINIMPTLIELIAPKGFEYYTIGRSLTKPNKYGINYGFWIDKDYVGKTDSAFMAEKINNSAQPYDKAEIENEVNAVRALSWWRSKYGSNLAVKLSEQSE